MPMGLVVRACPGQLTVLDHVPTPPLVVLTSVTPPMLYAEEPSAVSAVVPVGLARNTAADLARGGVLPVLHEVRPHTRARTYAIERVRTRQGAI